MTERAVHFVPYGSWKAPCGFTIKPGQDLTVSARWDRTTCVECLWREPTMNFGLWEDEMSDDGRL